MAKEYAGRWYRQTIGGWWERASGPRREKALSSACDETVRDMCKEFQLPYRNVEEYRVVFVKDPRGQFTVWGIGRYITLTLKRERLTLMARRFGFEFNKLPSGTYKMILEYRTKE